MTKKLLGLSVFLLLALSESCWAMEPQVLLKNMPASYSGTYVWESGDTWNMSVSFSSRKIGNNGEVEFTGKEYFVHVGTDQQNFESKIRAVVNANTLAFDMSEIYDQKKKNGFTPMVYTGTISSDLRTIEASWAGESGKVTLHLRPSSP